MVFYSEKYQAQICPFIRNGGKFIRDLIVGPAIQQIEYDVLSCSMAGIVYNTKIKAGCIHLAAKMRENYKES